MSEKLNNLPSLAFNAKDIEQLVFENKLFKQLMDELAEGIYITDEEERIIWLNKAVEKNDAVVREQVIGKLEKEVYGEIGRFHKYTAQTGQPVPTRHVYYYLPDGRRTDAIQTTLPYFEKNDLKAILTFGFYADRMQNLMRTVMAFESVSEPSKTIEANRTSYKFNDIIGKSEIMKGVVAIAKKAALSPSNIMINGETGTGKELFAQSIHNASPRRKGQFVAINCAAIPETLLESLLFGTVKGAYTGATESPGLFELASGGSLFLDEINSMPLFLQAKLLRVLQEKQVQRLGESKLRTVDCRIISASNVAPLSAVHQQVLREDIYFRLAAMTIHLPPLRARPTDIPILAEHLLEKKTSIYGKKTLAPNALELLKSYSWPGNVRELEHALEYALIVLEGDETLIENKHFPPYIFNGEQNKTAQSQIVRGGDNNILAPQNQVDTPNTIPLNQLLTEYETTLLTEVLARHKGHLTNAAKELGLPRQTLTHRLKRLKIKPS